MSDVTVGVDFDNPLTVDGIPTTFDLNIDKINLPKIELGVDPLTVTLTPVTVTLNPITIEPLDLSLRITEIPSIRAHLPADFSVGFSVLGLELFCVRICGEAQAITEPYRPNPCEECEEERKSPIPPRSASSPNEVPR